MIEKRTGLPAVGFADHPFERETRIDHHLLQAHDWPWRCSRASRIRSAESSGKSAACSERSASARRSVSTVIDPSETLARDSVEGTACSKRCMTYADTGMSRAAAATLIRRLSEGLMSSVSRGRDPVTWRLFAPVDLRFMCQYSYGDILVS